MGFRQVLMDCSLVELGYNSGMFTWERGRNTLSWTQERLDRGVVTDEWKTHFPVAAVHNLLMVSSDHCSIYLNLNGESSSPSISQRLRFENAWLAVPQCQEIVEESWVDNSGLDFAAHLHVCSSALWVWGSDYRTQFGDVQAVLDCVDMKVTAEHNDALL
ncbi:uncharacterized protein LOC122723976 [Manihot esculenta]|uniref:uncharacterized protein LOC122723976 n=1 Tax=Manihot esculenta TaxID=3983 RepID=UPI001CC6BD81|nr:uncharacterized protein LOC122723976 [Manihot esculenta]